MFDKTIRELPGAGRKQIVIKKYILVKRMSVCEQTETGPILGL